MAVPKQYMFYAPIMRALNDGKVHSFEKISIDVAEDMQLSAAALAELLPSKRNTVFDNRVSGALNDLVKKGKYVEVVSPNHYQLSEEGKELISDPDAVNSLRIRSEIGMKEFIRVGDELRQIIDGFESKKNKDTGW